MDEATLSNLTAAYAAAPSPALAKVIALALTESEDTSHKFADYVQALEPGSLSDDEAAKLFAHANTADDDSALLTCLNMTSPAQLDVAASLRTRLAEYARAAVDKTDAGNGDNVVSITGDDRPKLRVVEKDEPFDLTEVVDFKRPTLTFDDVVGLANVKKQITKKIILPFEKPSLYQRFRKKVGGGVMLYGPPGCGKTLIARATAGQARANFFSIQISDVLDMYIGESEQKLHQLFAKARAEKPSVLFFDEIEALAGKREHTRNNAAANVVSQFLSELDGFTQDNQGVLVLASTNTPWAIDAAFLRPGRFDRLFFVPPPDREARKGILALELKDRPVAGDISLATLAAKTSGYSGADLAHLVETAADEAIEDSILSDDEKPISSAHLAEALTETKSTTTEWLTTARNYARYANDGGRYDDVLAFIKQHGR